MAESGWLIERADSSPAAPQYYAGGDAWTSDHNQAVRFARKADGEAMALGNVRVCEHIWDS